MEVPAEQYDNSVALGGDESKHEDVLAPAVVTLRNRFSERAVRMKDDFLMLRADQMIDNVRGGCVSSGITKPLGTDETLDHAGG